MDTKELKLKGEAELQHLLSEERKRLDDLEFKDNQRLLKDVRDIREAKRSIAQILTVINSKKQ